MCNVTTKPRLIAPIEYTALRPALALILLLGVTLIASSASAQQATAKARFYFNFGAVDIELYGNESPLHVANFLGYVNSGAYDGSIIHRTVSRNPFGQPTAFFNQGGSFLLPPNPSPSNILSEEIVTGAPIDNEFDPANGLSNTPRTIAAARTSDPDSATSGWFFNVSDNGAGFDGQTAGTGFTVFGEVTAGWDLFSQVPGLPLLGEVFPSFSSSFQESAPLINGTTAVLLINAIEISTVAGDYNLDGTVDAADHAAWSSGFGQFPQASDGNSDAVISAADYTLWRDKVGATAASAVVSAVGVPEPTTAGGLAVLMLGAGWRRRRCA